ncbi:MAG: undecaprenyl-phosphate galactose phosphotransferase WbaP [Alphaproteobacteria bacterium]
MQHDLGKRIPARVIPIGEPQEALAVHGLPEATRETCIGTQVCYGSPRTVGVNAYTDPAVGFGTSLSSPRAAPHQFRSIAHFAIAGADVAAMSAAFLLSYFATAAANLFVLSRDFHAALSMGRFWQFSIVVAATLLALYARGHYRRRLPFWQEARDITVVLALAMLFDGALQFALKQGLSRLWLAQSWLYAVPIILAARPVTKRLLLCAGLWQLPTLLVGSDAQTRQASSLMNQEKTLGYEFVRTIDPHSIRSQPGFWQAQCHESGAQFVMLALSGRELEQNSESLVELARENIPHAVIPPLYGLPIAGVSAQYFFSHDLMLLIGREGLRQPMNRVLKSLLDFGVSGLALVLLAPLFAVLAFLVGRDGGPVFYRHRRIGKDGREFDCLKFRTMAPNADTLLREVLACNPVAAQEWHESFKLKDDPRVTQIGRFLRASSLDELPQLFNVLRGEMSLVGPRPIVAPEAARYGRDIAYYYSLRPGVTGLWQASGRSDLSYGERVRLDAWYVRNWSLWHDIAILAKTAGVVMKRAGAY